MGGIKAHYDGIVAFSQTDFTEDLKKITVPTLVMHGDDDQIVPYANSGPLSAKLVKGAILKTYQGFPHGMPTTHADADQCRSAGLHPIVTAGGLMALAYLTLIHVLISVVGIASGFGVLAGLLAGTVFPRWTALFLATTVATSVTGFFFPFRGVTPAFAFGVLSLVMLAVAIYARYARRLAGAWRRAYAITAVIALYLNFFVLIAQLFTKVPEMRALAPTQAEPPFLLTQLLVLAIFVGMGFLVVMKCRAAHPI